MQLVREVDLYLVCYLRQHRCSAGGIGSSDILVLTANLQDQSWEGLLQITQRMHA